MKKKEAANEDGRSGRTAEDLRAEKSSESDRGVKTDGARRTSRRRFTKAMAAALAAAPVAAAVSNAQQPAAPREPKAPPNPQPTPTPAPAAQRPSPVAEAYAEVARARFGGQLSEEEFARVKRDLAGYVRTSERLAAVKLKNSDEPDFIFTA